MTFNDNFDNVLKEHVPKKIKTTCTQYFEVNIMKRSHLKKKVNKTSLPSDKQNYKKKTKNFSPKIKQAIKKNYFENIEDKKCTYLLNKHNDGNSKLRRRKSFMKGLKLQMPFIHALNQ